MSGVTVPAGGQAAGTEPRAVTVLGGRFDETFGEWAYAVVDTPLIRPFTHWWPLPCSPLSDQPSPPAGEGEREAVARIVNPNAFQRWQSMYDYCLRQGDDEPTARRYADDTHKADCDKALATADAILAALRPAPSPLREDEKLRAHINGMMDAATICGTLAETTYDDTDGFAAATGCEAAIHARVFTLRDALAQDGEAGK